MERGADLKVEIINPEVLQNLIKSHGQFACECYNTNPKYSEKVGNICQESGHMSGSRTEYIKFKISGVDRGVMEQLFRHEIGTRVDDFIDVSIDPSMIVKNMKSFRYVNMENFDYTIPKIILKSEKATTRFKETMEQINKGLKDVKSILDSEFPFLNDKIKLEATQYQLPRATNTSCTVGFTIEALLHYMGKRLCIRSQPEHRDLAMKMKEEVEKLNKSISDRLIPICEYLLWCPEGNMSCGKVATKDKLKELIKK